MGEYYRVCVWGGDITYIGRPDLVHVADHVTTQRYCNEILQPRVMIPFRNAVDVIVQHDKPHPH